MPALRQAQPGLARLPGISPVGCPQRRSGPSAWPPGTGWVQKGHPQPPPAPVTTPAAAPQRLRLLACFAKRIPCPSWGQKRTQGDSREGY